MSCDLYAAIEQLYNNGMYSCVTELYPFIAASQTLSAAESANCALFQVTDNEILRKTHRSVLIIFIESAALFMADKV
jgi:hypothetical protein